jgi:hypothetical protein
LHQSVTPHAILLCLQALVRDVLRAVQVQMHLYEPHELLDLAEAAVQLARPSQLWMQVRNMTAKQLRSCICTCVSHMLDVADAAVQLARYSSWGCRWAAWIEHLILLAPWQRQGGEFMRWTQFELVTMLGKGCSCLPIGLLCRMLCLHAHSACIAGSEAAG